jgi:hypothetical protein
MNKNHFKKINDKKIRFKIKTDEFLYSDGELYFTCDENEELVIMPQGIIYGYNFWKPFKIGVVKDLIIKAFERYVNET